MSPATPRSEIGTTLESLVGIPAALAVFRLGSATAAAEQLGVGVATVLRRVEKLEEELGCVLFDRVQRGMRPTSAMERVAPLFEHVEGSCRAIQSEVAGLEQHPAGIVRLATLPVVASRLLMPGVLRLRTLHPGISLEMLPASAVVDLEGREADLALRLQRPTAGNLVAKQVARFALGAFASARLAGELAGRPPTAWPWVDWSGEVGAQPESRWLRGVVPEPSVVLRSSGLETLLSAAAAGAGAVVVAAPLGEAWGLSPLPMPGPAPEGSLYLVAHRALRHAPRVAAVWDWVVGQLDPIVARGSLRERNVP